MKNLLCILLLFAALETDAQEARIIKFNELEKIMTASSPELVVINFWATWCAPCVKELPAFEKLHAENNDALKVVLINLDYADKINRVNAFINRKKMKSMVLLLDEIDGNTWINKVEKNWSGAIPATLVINTKTGKRNFVEKELTEAELDNLIASVK